MADSGASLDGRIAGDFAPAGGPRAAPAKRPYRIIPEIDRYPRIVALAQGWPGRLVLFATFAILLNLVGGNPLVLPFTAACAFAGAYRRYVIPPATFVLLYQNGFWVDTELIARVAGQEGLASRINQPLLFATTLVLVFLLFCGLLAFWQRILAIGFFRRSTLCLIVGFLGVAVIAQSPVAAGMPRVLLWSFLMTVLPYLWFLAYALAEAGLRNPAPVWQHLGVFHPFWGSTLTPFAKGLSYLRKFEAKTAEELAVTQLKGVKLAAWTLLLAVGFKIFNAFVHGPLGLPDFDDTFAAYLARAGFPRYLCWSSLIAFFFEDLLNMAIWGGIIVACARMAGFRLLRNTWRPLEATTLAEFWNRYYFYYKELLVDHFFYPAFLRYFRGNRKLRMFFATFCAACVGNLLFHFIRDIRFVAELGWWKAVSGDASHALYTFLLAVGVGISQMRSRASNASQGWLRGRLLPCAWVALFFCILHVFDAPLDREHTIGQRGEYLMYLMGIDQWI